jgi:rubrerythrin
MKHNPMDASERELLALTRELEEMHGDLFGRFVANLSGLGEGWREQAEAAVRASRRGATRRTFLRGGLVAAGGLGAGLVAAACGGGSSSSGMGTVTSSSTTTTTAPIPELAVVRLAASLEVLAVSTYQSVLDAAGQQRLGTVPPAIATFLTTAKSQHAEHLSVLNSALAGAGKPPQTASDPKYQAVVDRALGTLTDVPGAARLALTLETVAVETYTSGAMAVTEPGHRQLVLSIAPVEAQHVAILNFVLGSSPVPDAFTRTDMAASTSDLRS